MVKIFLMANKNIHKIQDDIIQLTIEIENKYPEIYKTLQETPLSIHDGNKEEDMIIDLEKYLGTLKVLMKNAELNDLKPNEFECMLG
jgi:hypothetical protein